MICHACELTKTTACTTITSCDRAKECATYKNSQCHHQNEQKWTKFTLISCFLLLYLKNLYNFYKKFVIFCQLRHLDMFAGNSFQPMRIFEQNDFSTMVSHPKQISRYFLSSVLLSTKQQLCLKYNFTAVAMAALSFAKCMMYRHPFVYTYYMYLWPYVFVQLIINIIMLVFHL